LQGAADDALLAHSTVVTVTLFPITFACTALSD
jgi:hypothetical protein